MRMENSLQYLSCHPQEVNKTKVNVLFSITYCLVTSTMLQATHTATAACDFDAKVVNVTSVASHVHLTAIDCSHAENFNMDEPGNVTKASAVVSVVINCVCISKQHGCVGAVRVSIRYD